MWLIRVLKSLESPNLASFNHTSVFSPPSPISVPTCRAADTVSVTDIAHFMCMSNSVSVLSCKAALRLHDKADSHEGGGDETNLHEDVLKYLTSQIFGLRSCAEGGRRHTSSVFIRVSGVTLLTVGFVLFVSPRPL